MTTAIIGITIAYIALAALLLNLNLYSRWPAWVKISAIVVVSALYYITYISLQNFLGWPTKTELPDQFIMLSARVDEPNKQKSDDGAVYLWLLPLNNEGIAYSSPRSYKVPYSPMLHQEINRAQKQLRREIVQIGKVENMAATASKLAPGSVFYEENKRIIIYDLPDPELPDK